MSRETIERTFSVDGVCRLTVTNIRGLVDVQPGDEGTVAVTAIKHTASGDADRTHVEIEQAADGSVAVRTRFREGARAGKACKVDYVVRVPRACCLTARCVSSAMSVIGLEGTFDLETVSGKMRLAYLIGRITAVSVSGDVTGQRLIGPAAFKSVSGNVYLTDSLLSSLEGTSVDGEVAYVGALDDGPYRFQTVSGSVSLSVPAESRCSIDITNVSGRFRTSLPVTRSECRFGMLHADLRGGGPLIRFETISGHLIVAGQ
ncbi:MAG: hypothetical protein JXD18_10970 [Anaerolineae bacterium]|nr:hypothetical protein [Anaerolineae bacterium]